MCANGTVVASLQGLTYTLYCDWGITGDDFGSSTVQSFQDCVDGCTLQRPACYAVVWDPDGEHCYHRNGGSVEIARNLVGRAGLRSAVVSASQMGERQSVSNQQCPYPNLSKQKTATGMEFRILCGAYIYSHGDSSDVQIVHTKTMEECMNRCAEYHPLCKSVSFNTDINGSGWLNCVIRVGFSIAATPYTRTLAHSAVVVEQELERSSCHDNKTVESRDGQRFRTSCRDLRKLDDHIIPPISISHEVSMERCLETCADSNSTCKSAVFDVGLQQGFQNCYLFDGVPPVNVRDNNVTFVYLESLSHQYLPPPTEQNRHPNLAWIAVLIIIPFIPVIWCCCRRRKMSSEKHRKKLN